jgi:glycine/D-amino acid oxidase-like deaminating enzyme
VRNVEHRDLRSGESPWEKDFAKRSDTPVIADLKCDIAIVGGGVSGALLAEALSAHGFSIVVVDRRGVARGATAASTALVEFELDNPLTQLISDIGRERAERIYCRSLQSVSNLLKKLERLGIDCQQLPRETLYLCGDILNPNAMAEEVEARREISLPSEYLPRSSILDQFGIKRDAAILSSGSAQLNPVLLTQGLIAHAKQRGAQIFEGDEIVQFDAHSDSVTAYTKSNRAIEAKYLIFATGYELLNSIPRSGFQVVSTWAMQTISQEKLWPREVMISEASEPYLYIRAHGNKVIVGGEDEPTGNAGTRKFNFEEKIAAIQDKLRTMLPQLNVKAEYAWTGAFGKSDLAIPRIGKIPGYPRCYSVMGFGGNGTTFSEIAAQIITNELIGTPDPDAALFAFEEPALTPP